jgi:hypothetical protein
MGQLLYTVPVSIMHPGLEHIIIRDPGHGDSTLRILHISAGGLDGDMERVGLASDSDSDMVTGMDMAITDVAGGVRHIIIQPAGVAGMEPQDLMDSMEIISM